MRTVHLYSDETGQHTGGRFFIVAGIAVADYRMELRRNLAMIEAASGKGTRDWYRSDEGQLIAYLSAVLKLIEVRGRLFCRIHENVKSKDYWQLTRETILAARARFCDEDDDVVIIHEGFKRGSREKLVRELRRESGSFRVWPGDLEKWAEIRLADALANLVSQASFPTGSRKACGWLLPDWCIKL